MPIHIDGLEIHRELTKQVKRIAKLQREVRSDIFMRPVSGLAMTRGQLRRRSWGSIM